MAAGLQLIVERVKTGAVSIIQEAPKAISFLCTLDDPATLKECKAQAAAISEYLAQRKDTSVAEYNAAFLIKTRVEHRLGEVLAKTVKHKGLNQHSKNGAGDTESPALPKPITKKQSSRAQQLAKVPWKEIQRRVEADTKEQRRASQSRITKLLKRRELEEKVAAAPNVVHVSWRIIHGDCIEALSNLAERPRLIFADPPYNIGIDYGEGTKADALPEEKYLDWCRARIRLCAEKLADGGTFWLLINDEWADHFGIILRQNGLYRRAWVKWYETFGVNCSNNFNRCSRHLFYCVKDKKRFVFNAEAVNRPSDRQTKYGDNRANPAGKIWDDVWMIPRLVGTAKERIPDFPTQLPLELLRPIIGSCSDPGDLVLDPFCGSASTGVAAVELGREFIGIEKSKQFASLGAKRMKALGA